MCLLAMSLACLVGCPRRIRIVPPRVKSVAVPMNRVDGRGKVSMLRLTKAKLVH